MPDLRRGFALTAHLWDDAAPDAAAKAKTEKQIPHRPKRQKTGHMRSSNKSRSRNKNQNRRSSANIINRVFDSSGPEGKVRGTPQQIIEKYQTLARDAQLSGDRVAAENFQQHAEHYTRLLGEAMREQAARREAHEAQQAAQQAQRREEAAGRNGEARNAPPGGEQPDIVELVPEGESSLVETPENKPRRRRSRGGGGDKPVNPTDAPG